MGDQNNDNMSLILKRLTSIETSLTTLSIIKDDISTLKSNLNGVIDSQVLINAEFEEQKKQMESITKRNQILEKHVTTLHRNMEEKSSQISTLHSSLNDLEQYGRRPMVDIRGIPRWSNENTDQLIIDLSKLIKVNISHDDIDISHRVSGDEKAAIIVKFATRKKRNEFFNARKNLETKSAKDLGFDSTDKIFINESLTPANGLLMKEARIQLKKTGLAKFVWSSNGRIFVKESEKTKTYQVKSKHDVQQLQTIFERQMKTDENNGSNEHSR